MSFDLIKLGRNELCPCDSGKKYKKCCLFNPTYEDDEETPQDRAATLLGRKRLLEKLKSDDMIISSPIDSMPKISGAILELAKEMLDSARNKSHRKTAITAACVAWNIAVLATEEGSLEDELSNFFAACVEEDQEDFRQIILSMVTKKTLLFPDDTRLIVDFEIVDTKTYFSVNVASKLPI